MSTLSPLVSSFVGHFGEMGSRWGINRTVGQIYALIYVSAQALHADEIAEKLEFSPLQRQHGLEGVAGVAAGPAASRAWRPPRIL